MEVKCLKVFEMFYICKDLMSLNMGDFEIKTYNFKNVERILYDDEKQIIILDIKKEKDENNG